MDSAPDIAAALADWLARLAPAACHPGAVTRELTFAVAPFPEHAGIGALAALAAEALAHERTLTIVTADDALLPEISNALDLRLRPLCLVLPGASHASHIALRATLALLKSRLTRAASDSEGPAWSACRARLAEEDALWRACLAWSARGLEREAPPPDLPRLFSVRVCPAALARAAGMSSDWVVLLQSGTLPAALCAAWPDARATLLLRARAATSQAPATIDTAARQRAELEVLTQELAELELELATAQAELAAFTTQYHERIAGRLTELDRLQAQLAQARMQQAPADHGLRDAAQQACSRAEQSRREYQSFQSGAQPHDAARFAPKDDLKKRFRQLAQKIHPDRASDEDDRAWRTQLMSEANRAYRAGDAAALEEVFILWREGQSGRPAAGNDAVSSELTFRMVDRLAAQIAAVQRRLAAIAAELDRLYGSRLYELFAAARVADKQGRDLLAEMARRLDAQIAQAQAELATL